jgi:hypothetical protein
MMPYLIRRTDNGGHAHRTGRDVLEALRRESPDGRSQAFYDGLRNPRELAHDLTGYRAIFAWPTGWRARRPAAVPMTS